MKITSRPSTLNISKQIYLLCHISYFLCFSIAGGTAAFIYPILLQKPQ